MFRVDVHLCSQEYILSTSYIQHDFASVSYYLILVVAPIFFFYFQRCSSRISFVQTAIWIWSLFNSVHLPLLIFLHIKAQYFILLTKRLNNNLFCTIILGLFKECLVALILYQSVFVVDFKNMGICLILTSFYIEKNEWIWILLFCYLLNCFIYWILIHILRDYWLGVPYTKL